MDEDKIRELLERVKEFLVDDVMEYRNSNITGLEPPDKLDILLTDIEKALELEWHRDSR